MADNVTIPLTGAGDATAVVGTDTIAGVAYQRTKVVWGVDGTVTDTSATNPLPVTQAVLNPLDYDTGAGTVSQGIIGIALPASGGPVGVSTTNPLPAAGNVAHDAADAGNPVKVGAKALSYGTNPTGVANADRTDVYANVAGIPFMLGGHPNIITRRDNYTSAQTDTAIITVSGGTKIVVTSCTFACAHSNTVDVASKAGFATATTPTGAGCYISHPGIAPGAGIREAGAVAGADGEDFRITCTVPTGGSIDVLTKYFTIES